MSAIDTKLLLQQPDQTHPNYPETGMFTEVSTDPETGERWLTVKNQAGHPHNPHGPARLAYPAGNTTTPRILQWWTDGQLGNPDPAHPAILKHNPATGAVVFEAYYQHGKPYRPDGLPVETTWDPETRQVTKTITINGDIKVTRFYESDGAITTIRDYPQDRDLPTIQRINPDGLCIEEWVDPEGVPVERPGDQPNYVETYTEFPADGTPVVVTVSKAWFDKNSELHREGDQPALIVYNRETGKPETVTYARHGEHYTPKDPAPVLDRPLLEPVF